MNASAGDEQLISKLVTFLPNTRQEVYVFVILCALIMGAAALTRSRIVTGEVPSSQQLLRAIIAGVSFATGIILILMPFDFRLVQIIFDEPILVSLAGFQVIAYSFNSVRYIVGDLRKSKTLRK